MYGLKLLQKLDQKKYRDEIGSFLVEGKNGVMDALNSEAEVTQLVVSDHFVRQHQEFCRQPEVQNFFDKKMVLKVADAGFAQLSDTSTPQGVAVVVKKPANSFAKLLNGKTLAIFDDIRDPGNMGTMIRTADWFGVDGVIFHGGADPFQPKVVRASMGSIFHVPVYDSQDIEDEVSQLKTAGFQVISTRPELAGQPNKKISTDQKHCLIFGNEARGTSAELDRLANQGFSIPRFGAAESLNVAVSFGVVLYEFTRQQG